jgi:hypothetical protein
MAARKTRPLKWSADEERLLVQQWTLVSLGDIAKQLGRTPAAVFRRKTLLGLGPASRGRKSLARFCAETGYARSRVVNACQLIRAKVRRLPQSTYQKQRKGRKGRRVFLSETQQQQVLALLAGVPDGKRLYGTRTDRTEAGKWGVGRKPKACLGGCKTDRPHRARGYCVACYQRIVQRGNDQ